MPKVKARCQVRHAPFTKGIGSAKASVLPAKHIVSAAAIFNPHSKRKEQTVAVDDAVHRVPIDRSVRTKPTSLSSAAKTGTASDAEKGLHPLAFSFNSTTLEYRRHLYANATVTLGSTLTELLAQLYDCNTAATSAPQNKHDAAEKSNRVTVPQEFHHISAEILKPVGLYSITTRGSHSCDSATATKKTLQKALVGFSDRYRTSIEELDRLQEQWEKIVGEIWKFGVQSLGEKNMSGFLSVQEPYQFSPLAFSKDDNQISLELKPKTTRKRVTFDTPRREPPAFLHAPSVYTKAIPVLSKLTFQDVADLQQAIKTMGTRQISEFSGLDKDHKRWWLEKSRAIANVLNAIDE